MATQLQSVSDTLPPSEAGLRDALVELRRATSQPPAASPPQRPWWRWIPFTGKTRKSVATAPESSPHISLAQLAESLRKTQVNGIVSNSGSIIMPAVDVYWREAETAHAFADTLELLDPSELSSLRTLVEGAVEILAVAKSHKTREPVVAAYIADEMSRIALIGASEADPATNDQTSDTSGETREQVRSAIDESELLLVRAQSVAPLLAARSQELENAWFLARIAGTVGSTMAQQTRPADAVHQDDSRPVLKALAELLPMLEQLRKAMRMRKPSAASPTIAKRWKSCFLGAIEGELATIESFRNPFLKLPSKEGTALVKKLLNNFGEHLLLPAGTLAGFVALCAYIKASLELDTRGLSPLALITATDAANIAIALAVPFVLLLASMIALAQTWNRMLALDHERSALFSLQIAFFLLVLLAFFGVFRGWWPSSSWDVADWVWSGLIGLGVLPAAALVIAGRLKGVTLDDWIQMRVLGALRFTASNIGLLVAMAIVGCTLIFDDRAAVLFPSVTASGNADDLRVLETKTGERMLVASSSTRLDGRWLVQRAPDTENTLHALDRSQVISKNWPLVFVATDDVVCFRRIDPTERSAHQLANHCLTPPDASLRTPSNNSIAKYAIERFDCDQEGFDSAAFATVMTFDLNLPRTKEAAMLWPEENRPVAWQVPAYALLVPALRGIGRPPRAVEQERATWLPDALTNDPASTVWIFGFASSTGDSSGNLDLAQRRAIALRQTLFPAGAERIPAFQDRVRLLSFGDSALSGAETGQEAQVAVAFLCR